MPTEGINSKTGPGDDEKDGPGQARSVTRPFRAGSRGKAALLFVRPLFRRLNHKSDARPLFRLPGVAVKGALPGAAGHAFGLSGDEAVLR